MTTISTDAAVGALVAERPARARLFEQLGLDYCCGGRRPLAEACRERGLDPDTVVALLTALEEAPPAAAAESWSDASLGDLCDHIVEAHHGFLRRELPRLSTLLVKVERAHAGEDQALHEVRDVFERLRGELEAHLADEERAAFPAIRSLDGDGADAAALAAVFGVLEAEHAEAGALLRRLRELTYGFDTERAFCNTHRAALDALRDLELDLHEHIHEENNILFPRARQAVASGSA